MPPPIGILMNSYFKALEVALPKEKVTLMVDWTLTIIIASQKGRAKIWSYVYTDL